MRKVTAKAEKVQKKKRLRIMREKTKLSFIHNKIYASIMLGTRHKIKYNKQLRIKYLW